MTRLIDADALIRKVQYMVEDGERCVEIINIIETAPTIDVVPRSLYEKLMTKHTQTDLISRADAMNKCKNAENELTDEAERKGLRVARFIIGGLPSADRPSGDSCYTCVYWNAETHGCKRNPSVEEWTESDYCSYYSSEETSRNFEKLQETDGDLISRAEAIKAVSEDVMGGLNYERILQSLPSAELTLQTPQTYGKSINPSNAEVVADYISRADAIKAVRKLAESEASKMRKLNKGDIMVTDIDFSYLEVIDNILALPSAEAVSREWYEDVVKANHGLAKEICELKAKIESAEADCSTCKHKDKDWDSEECDSCCGNNNHYASAEADVYEDYEHATLVDIKEPLKASAEAEDGTIYYVGKKYGE